MCLRISNTVIMALDLWIYTWIGLSVFVASVRGSTSSWAVGKMRGEVDSVGYFCYWTDLSLPTEFPHPMDDTDNICIEIQDFVLVHYDHSYVDLLHDPDLETSVATTRELLGIYGHGQSITKSMRAFSEDMSSFLYIFSDSGNVFSGSDIVSQVVKGQAVFGIRFPPLSPEAEVRNECLSEKCQLQITFSLKGAAASRSQEETGTNDKIHINIGENAAVSIFRKAFREDDVTGRSFTDVTISLASQSPTETLVTVTIPLTDYSYVFPVLLTTTTTTYEVLTTDKPTTSRVEPEIQDGGVQLPLRKPEEDVTQYYVESYPDDEAQIKLTEDNNVSVIDLKVAASQDKDNDNPPENSAAKTTFAVMPFLLMLAAVIS